MPIKVTAGCSVRVELEFPTLTVLTGDEATKVRRSTRTKWRAGVLLTVHLLIAAHIAHYVVVGRTLSPVEPSETMYTLENGYLNAGVVFFAIALLGTLVFGRFFCGWGCHILALQDLCAALLRRVGIRPRPFRSRLLVFVPGVVAAYMFVWRPWRAAWLMRPASSTDGFTNHLMTTQFWATFPGPIIAALTFLVCGFGAVYFLGAKGFCTYGCPYGALFGVASRLAPGRIVVSDACEGCGHCTASCTSNVRVHEEVRLYGMVVDPGCMKCLNCISVCPKNALRFGFSRPPVFAPAARRRYDFSWPEEVALALVCLVATLAYRGLYDILPLLMAVGLGGVTAFVTLKLWRLVRDPSVRLQNLQLKAAGRTSRAGWVFASLSLLWLAVTFQSAFVQWHRAWGRRYLEQAKLTMTDLLEGANEGKGKPGRSSVQYAAAADLAYRSFREADRWGLLGIVEVKLGLAAIEVRRHDLEAAETHLREAITLEPGTPRLYLNLYIFLMQQNQIRQAARVLDAKLAATPPTAADHFRLAALLLLTKRPEQAADHYRATIALAPGWAKPRYNLGGLLRRLGQTAAAIEQLEAARRLAPDDPATEVELGLACAAAGANDKALAALRRAAARDPKRVESYASLVEELERANRSRPE
jgi:tetratricopeptide (TPR) repeat protein/NAD-dependent dihydropyrimidine dehydrogenase PreA subunit